MLIRCPECHFGRHIDPDAISPAAVRATCPRCKAKFYFRNPDGSFVQFDEEEPTSPSATSATPSEETLQPTAHSHARLESEQDGDDPLPPGAVIPPVISPVGTDPAPDHTSGQASEASSTAPNRQSASSPTVRDQQKSSEAPNAPRGKSAPSVLSAFGARMQEARAALSRNLPGRNADDNSQPNTADANGEDEGSKSFAGRFALAGDNDVPWELPEKYGFFPSLYQTILRVLFGAPRFFAALPQTTTSWARPVAFYILLGMFQTIMERMWYLMSFQAMGPSITDPKVAELLGAMAHEMSLPMALILAPATLAMQLAFYSAVFYLMLRLVQPENASFPLVLRIISYSAAPAVVCVVPLMGSLANAVWFAVCCLIGCKYALNMPWNRVFLALGPLYLIAFAILGQFMRQLLG